MFVVNNRNLFLDNVELYTIKARNSYNLHPPLSHLTKYQKGVHCVGIRIFSHLPTSIKSIANETKELKKTWTIHFILWMNFLIIRNNVYSSL